MVYKVTAPNQDQVARMRKLRKLSIEEAADLIGVEVQTWRNYEKGRRVMCAQFWELFNLKSNGRRFR